MRTALELKYIYLKCKKFIYQAVKHLLALLYKTLLCALSKHKHNDKPGCVIEEIAEKILLCC